MPACSRGCTTRASSSRWWMANGPTTCCSSCSIPSWSQFQMSTITAGFVAAEYFLKYPGRFSSMHLQDVDMSAPAPAPKGGGRRGGRRPQVAVGQGSIDWVRTFTAAKLGGVKNYFVEQNWELTRQSVAYLKTLKV